MAIRETQTIIRQQFNFSQFASVDRDGELVTQRLNALLAINTETARQKATYRSEKEKVESDLMKNPLSLDKTFSYFGLLLGVFPPAAMFIRFAIDGRLDLWVFGVMFIVNLISAVVGFFSGKLIAKAVGFFEKLSWTTMILVLPFLGLLWGMISGGAGGIIIFIIGAFFGAIIGGIVGSAALPVFTILHRLLKKGEMIELKHFLPIAFGVTFIICGFILGL
ncbi:MAG: hypothetical protein ABJA66_07055 [Actinomycetota bacterium]